MQRFSTHVSGLADDGVLVVTIDNPPVNALSQDVRAGLMAALVFAKDDPAIAGMVITGAGKTFIGGADIKEFGKPPAEPLLPTVIDAIEAFEKPVVAAINGAALGGGLEVALACHYRVAAAGAKLGLPEVKLGLVPGAGGTQRLPRLIGLAAALDMIVTGKPVDAAAAQANGTIDAVSETLVADAVARPRRPRPPASFARQPNERLPKASPMSAKPFCGFAIPNRRPPCATSFSPNATPQKSQPWKASNLAPSTPLASSEPA